MIAGSPVSLMACSACSCAVSRCSSRRSRSPAFHSASKAASALRRSGPSGVLRSTSASPAACSSRKRFFSSEVLTKAALGVARPICCMASRKSSRSSALSMASAVAPIISTPNFSSTPMRRSDSAVLSAVWPPMVGSSASLSSGRSARSFSMILATISGVIGSI